MRTEIFLENKKLDLLKDISAEFTYSIDDIKDFSSRNTSYSKTIVIPGNATNNRLFGHIFEFGSANDYDDTLPNLEYNYNASKSAACLVFIDGIQIFKGILRLLEIVIDNGSIEYECAVFGELGGFIDAIGNERLEDLDFSTYDHAWTISNIENSWDNASGQGYYYPLVDYGKVSTNKSDYDIKAYRPALFVKEYIDKIIDGSGYTYECEFFDTPLFNRLVIPQNGKELLKTTNNPLQAYITNNTTMLTSVGIDEKDVPFTTTILGGMTQNLGKTEFTYTLATPLTVEAYLQIYGNLQSFKTVFIKVYQNSNVVYTSQQTSAGPITRPYFVNATFPITLLQNDVLRIEFSVDANGNNPYLVTIQNVTFTLTGQSSQAVPANFGDVLTMNTNIPRGIFQRDFFTSIVKMFNLYVLEDQLKPKHLIIKPYIQYYQSPITYLGIDDYFGIFKITDEDNLILSEGAFNYLDWSYKVDRSRTMKLKPMSEINGRYFEFKYKADIDWYNEQYQKKYSQGYGDRIEDTGYEFAKDKQTCEIIFSTTPLVGYDTDDKLVSAIFKLSNNVEDPTEHNIRILQIKKKACDSYLIKNGNTIVATKTFYGYGGHLDDPDTPVSDLNFGAPKEIFFTPGNYPSANLFNGFWSDYVAEITDKDSKLLTCYVRLVESDIYSLDFSKLIYIDGALWRLNTIEDFSTDDTTKCTFLRVINTTYE